MKFPDCFKVADLALGLTAVACSAERDHTRLDSVREMLSHETHASIFDRAQEIASEYHGMMRIEHLSHVEMCEGDIQGFAIGQTDKGWICAMWGGDSGPMVPNAYKEIVASCQPPEVWAVFRAYPVTVQ